jgi:ribosomal 50S subunit-recycling heat shock protein
MMFRMSETPADNVVPEESPETVETAETDAQGVEHIRVEIRRTRGDRRLDKYLSGRLGKNTSRAKLQRLIKEGAVTVNDKPVKASYTICPGDMIDMHIPTTKPKEIPAEDIPLDIIYEDDDVLAVNKQPNLIFTLPAEIGPARWSMGWPSTFRSDGRRRRPTVTRGGRVVAECGSPTCRPAARSLGRESSTASTATRRA